MLDRRAAAAWDSGGVSGCGVYLVGAGGAPTDLVEVDAESGEQFAVWPAGCRGLDLGAGKMW